MRRVQDPLTGDIGYSINGQVQWPADDQTSDDLFDLLETSEADWYEHLADCAREGDSDD